MNQAIYDSPIGFLHISGTEDAICGITFAENSTQLNEKPGESSSAPFSGIIHECMNQLDQYFSGNLFEFTFKIAQQGTAFQQKVWKYLLEIGYGKTESYLSLSRQIGNVKAIRAVGTANGKNNIAIVVPCHRVIGSNGSLIGYSGNLWRKQWLLKHEGKYGHGIQELF